MGACLESTVSEARPVALALQWKRSLDAGRCRESDLSTCECSVRRCLRAPSDVSVVTGETTAHRARPGCGRHRRGTSNVSAFSAGSREARVV